MSSIKAVIILIVAGLLASVTIPKLWKMCQIRGLLPGAIATPETVKQKWHETVKEFPLDKDIYWISWSEVDIRKVGSHRLNVERHDWDKIAIGDPIEIIKTPNSDFPNLRNGIFASFDNFAFDCILLALEVGVAVIMLAILIRNSLKPKQHFLKH